MKESQVSNRKISGWLDDFVNSLSKKKEDITASVKQADININDLPKVVWNDETFHVLFDEKGAQILNGFGITVQTLENVTTIEEVDKALNSKQVIVAENEEAEDIFAEELKKAAAYIKEADLTNTTPSNPTGAQENQIMQQELNQQPEQPAQPTTPEQPKPEEPAPVAEPVQASVECEEVVEDIEEEITKKASIFDLMNKVAELEQQVVNLNQEVLNLKQQEYAHAEKPVPGELDLNVEQTELQHVQEMANATEQEIEQEHQIDLTTPAGRISLKDRLKNDLNTIMTTDDANLNVNQEELDLLNKPEMSMEMGVEVETPAMETTEEPIEEVKPEQVEVDPEVGSNEEVPTENPELPQEETVETESTEEPVEEVKPEEEKEEKEMVVKLNEKDTKIFKKGICPDCGENHVVKANAVGKMVGLYCQGCDTEYAVDTETEEIYKKNK